jgi:hypothetical protein
MYMNLKDYPTLHLDKLVKEGAAFINVHVVLKLKGGKSITFLSVPI